jgi:hypothetical protein
MSGQYKNKLKKILHEWPAGTVSLLPWFRKFGGYRQLIKKYEKGEWIKCIGRGAYIQQNDNVDWTGGLYAIQYQQYHSAFIGGKTALELKGYMHNIPMGKGRIVTILNYENKKLPSWFQQVKWDVTIHYQTLNLFPNNPDIALTEKKINQYKVKLSAPERAILEMMALTPNHHSFEDAMHMMEGLMSPRISLLQNLLQQCTSIKAKRLFVYFADLCNMPWISNLDTSKIDLGKGVQSLCKDGKYIHKYRITVPKYLSGDRLEDIP